MCLTIYNNIPGKEFSSSLSSLSSKNLKLKTEFVRSSFKYDSTLVFTIILMSGIPIIDQAPVVQSIVSLTRSLICQLVKCFMTFWPNTTVALLFYVHGKHLRSFWDGQLT